MHISDPMRITKKFAGAACIGKRVFQPCERTPETIRDLERAEAELENLERQFQAAMAEYGRSKKSGLTRNGDSSSSLRSMNQEAKDFRDWVYKRPPEDEEESVGNEMMRMEIGSQEGDYIETKAKHEEESDEDEDEEDDEVDTRTFQHPGFQGRGGGRSMYLQGQEPVDYTNAVNYHRMQDAPLPVPRPMEPLHYPPARFDLARRTGASSFSSGSDIMQRDSTSDAYSPSAHSPIPEDDYVLYYDQVEQKDSMEQAPQNGYAVGYDLDVHPRWPYMAPPSRKMNVRRVASENRLSYADEEDAPRPREARRMEESDVDAGELLIDFLMTVRRQHCDSQTGHAPQRSHINRSRSTGMLQEVGRYSMESHSVRPLKKQRSQHRL